MIFQINFQIARVLVQYCKKSINSNNTITHCDRLALVLLGRIRAGTKIRKTGFDNNSIFHHVKSLRCAYACRVFSAYGKTGVLMQCMYINFQEMLRIVLQEEPVENRSRPSSVFVRPRRKGILGLHQ